MLIRSVCGVLAALYLANGLFMLWDPSTWYATTPGVRATGPLNPHFVRDVGFIYLLCGLAYLPAARGQAWPWLAIGTAWPALHAGLHVTEWIAHGPPGGRAFVLELFGVVLAAGIGLTFAAWAWRGQHGAALRSLGGQS
jgi:hypothetical protein